MKQIFSFLTFSFLVATPIFSQSGQIDSTEGKIFKVVEEEPIFSGCDPNMEFEERKKCAKEKMLKFIEENLDYPKEALENNIEGKVYAMFVVETDGSISNIEIVRDLGYGSGEEVVRMIETMPTWVPAKTRGKIVRCRYNLPVWFILPPEPKKKKRG